jgi:hypothetical protein
MRADNNALLRQIDSVDLCYGKVQQSSFTPTYVGAQTYVNADVYQEFVALSLACIERLVGRDNAYWDRAQNNITGVKNTLVSANGLYGVICALKNDIKAGYIATLRELVHADVFADLLETSEYFLEEGHKDPAAVMIGGVLEEHLRQLCQKNSIILTFVNGRGETKQKMGDQLNSELAQIGVYGKLEQKQVTAWLDLRNKAAHGRYNEFSAEQVRLFLMGLRDFIQKYPA